MKSLIELGKEISEKEATLQLKKVNLDDLNRQKKAITSEMEVLEREIYQSKLHLSHIKEIFRLAKIQFSRLRNSPENVLSNADIKELDKWVGRVKLEDGLIDIRNAIVELDKYTPSDIKSNLYALVQKIIIEGPYKKVKK